MFLAPQSAALRCPWMSALLVPVVRVPFVPVVRLVYWFIAHAQQNCTVVRYSTVGT